MTVQTARFGVVDLRIAAPGRVAERWLADEETDETDGIHWMPWSKCANVGVVEENQKRQTFTLAAVEVRSV